MPARRLVAGVATRYVQGGFRRKNMKLAYSPASPYVRKVTASAIKRGIDDRIERLKIGTTDPALLQYNPLSKVPTLVMDDGMCIYDSPVICEYLDSVGTAPRLFPASGAPRWKALTQMALGDGILDATQPRRRELTLPQDEGRKSYIELQQGKVRRAVDLLEKEAGTLGELETIGEITIGCALGYLDFRYANEAWRPGHPKLEAWYAKVVKLPPLAATMPVG
ncbi:glutathione S-transferase N-terminal domain-containing protein [Reyranella sp.]|jgi:glutathione S-transferase|uniref:glutathione S-transferase N-terminal domain-containing protein n=1 Tax=Reyranella sp. TaxID=1929291 RepID=UPI002F91C4D3